MHNWDSIFKRSEFDSPDLPGSGDRMSVETMRKLRLARAKAGTAFVINSGYRTPAHNKKVGGATASAHTRGNAVDIKAVTSTERYAILTSLLAAGFTRIGIYSRWIHADDDPTLAQKIIWFG